MPKTETTYVQLDYKKDGTVVVTLEDQDRFVITVQEAVAACRGAKEVLEYRRQFVDGLVPTLKKWLEARKKKVRTAYLTVRDGGILFLVVRKDAAYDGDFTDELTSLELLIAHDPSLKLIRVDVLALPDISDEAARSFLSPGRVKELADAK